MTDHRHHPGPLDLRERAAAGEPGTAMPSHGDHAGHGDHAAMFRDRFWFSLVLAIPVVFWSEGFQMLLGYT
ncbi:MAG: hypothetical protein ACREX8_19780, partial [Gammaproteobacteria bacterium]